MSIGARIKLVVDQSGMNAKAFAQAVGMPYTSLHGYMKDLREPGASAIEKICSQTGIDANWLLTGVGGMHRTQPAVRNSPIDDELLSDIIEVLERVCTETQTTLSADKKAKAIAYLYGEYRDNPKVEPATVVRVLRLVA